MLSAERRSLFEKASWVAAPFIVSQFIRLASNVVLAWLLAPQLFGVMLLINTFRTGAELLTDIGIGQSIVSHRLGGQTKFYNTAWTIQIIRGFSLFLIALSLTVPLAKFYENEEFLLLLPAMAPIFLLTGFTSPARFLLQKRLEVRTQALFDLAVGALGAIVQISLAWAIPNIWALIFGSLIATFISMIASYFIMDWRTLRFSLDKSSARSILNFGKWMFISSLVYFLASNFDRLYLAEVIPFSLLGIYGIARIFSDAIMLLFYRISNLIIFPMISLKFDREEDLLRRIKPVRLGLLACVAIALALAVALADELLSLIYDARYQEVGIILTILLFGTWFGILATISDAMMMGIGKPAGVASANTAKLLVIVIGLPLAFSQFEFVGCLFVLVLAESLRYVVLMLGTRRSGLGFSRQDLAMSICFFSLVVILREMTMIVGLTDGLGGWFKQLEALHE